MLEISKKVFDSFERLGIIYCHWKSNEHIIPGLDGDTDLDILVDINNKDQVLEIYKELGVINLDPQYGSRYPNVEDYVGFDESTGKLIHLHQHYKIVTGHTGLKEFTLPYDDVILSTRVKHTETGVFVSRPEAELYILFLRIVFKSNQKTYNSAKKGHYELKKDVLNEIVYLKERCTRQSCTDFYEEHGMDSKLIPFIWDEPLSSKRFIELYDYVYLNHSNFSRYSPINRKILVKVYPTLIQINRAFRKRLNWNVFIKKKLPMKGVSVGFIGQDGCGKSTVTKEIEKWLLWKMDAQRFYLGSGDYFNPWQKKALKLVGKRKKTSIGMHLSGILSVSLCCKASKNALTQLKKAKKYVDKGGIALFDRFPQTQYEGIFDGPKVRKLFLKKTTNPIFKHIISSHAKREEKNLIKTQRYQPTIVFKLILSVDESMRRKPENNRADIEQKHQIANQLTFNSSRVVMIDAEMPYEQEIIKIKKAIWETILER